MTNEDQALSLSEIPAVKNKIIKRKLSFEKLYQNKYINYTEDELSKLNEKRKNEIIELDDSNKKLKEKLTKTIEELNSLITSNSEILFQEQNKNTTPIENLEKIYYLRKQDHTLSLKYNATYKQQYKALIIRAKNIDGEKISTKIMNDKDMLEKIKNENSELNKRIKELEFSNIKQRKEFEILNFKQKSENNINNFTNILNESSLTRFEYHDKVENQKKSIEQLKEQFNNLNEYINKNKNKIIESDKGETALKKINTELELIKKDLSKKVDVIIQNCYDNKISLMQEDNTTINGKKKSNLYLNSKLPLNKCSSMQNININTQRNSINSNFKKRLNPLKIGEKSQSILFNISITNNNYINNNNINIIKKKSSIDTNIIKTNKNLSLFKKFKILKSNKPLIIGSSSSSKRINNVSMFVTKEVIDFNKKTTEEEELENDINKIDENDYQQLIDLKGNYLNINERLFKDIKERKKICFNRIKKLNIYIENNIDKLKQIKDANEIMKKDLNELEFKIKDKLNKKNIKIENIKINGNENKNETKNVNEKKNEIKDMNNNNEKIENDVKSKNEKENNIINNNKKEKLGLKLEKDDDNDKEKKKEDQKIEEKEKNKSKSKKKKKKKKNE